MRLVFWAPLFEGTLPYLKANSSLQDLSEKLPFIFACSGGIEKEVLETCGSRSIVMTTISNHITLKGYMVYEMMKHSGLQYDFLVKIDMDAVLFDIDKMVDILTPYLGRPCLVGNMLVKRGVDYIRGGAQATSALLVEQLYYGGLWSWRKRQKLDSFLSAAVDRISPGYKKDDPLFEFSDQYSGELPVYHPSRKRSGKWAQFERALSLYEESYREKLRASLENCVDVTQPEAPVASTLTEHRVAEEDYLEDGLSEEGDPECIS